MGSWRGSNDVDCTGALSRIQNNQAGDGEVDSGVRALCENCGREVVVRVENLNGSLPTRSGARFRKSFQDLRLLATLP